MQVAQNFNPISYDRILQCIAVQIPKLVNYSNTTRRNLSEFKAEGSKYTREGRTPKEGVYADDGSIFIGNYPSDQWGSDTVRPFHEEIAKARSSRGKSGGGRYQSRNKKKSAFHIKAARRKLSKLKREVENLEEKKRNISGVSAETATPPATSTALVVCETQAGTAFGGKSAKRAKQSGQND